MDFILALHSHLPYVLHHGRWPHGSDWLCEAAVDTYLPLLETLQALEENGVDAPVTLGITPVLASQLANPAFVTELDAFFAQRLTACDGAPAALAATGDSHLLPVAEFWRRRLATLQGVLRRADNDLIGAFRGFQERGRLELISSAATHGFLPLLGRDESIRLQLAAGRGEHRRLFGVLPTGCWLPECAFRPSGPCVRRVRGPAPSVAAPTPTCATPATATSLWDAHLPQAGEFLGVYSDIPLGAMRADGGRDAVAPHEAEAKPRHCARPIARTACPPLRRAHCSRPWSAIRVRRARCGAGRRATRATRGT